MQFVGRDLQDALVAWRANTDALERAAADNLQFEERVSDSRLRFFEDWARLRSGERALDRQLTKYWKTFVATDVSPPHTFLRELDPADLGDLDDEQILLRYENLSRPLSDHGISFDDLKRAWDASDHAAVDAFVDVWNQSTCRDWRPAFGAFRDELLEELPPADWSVLMRNRLGLAHHSCAYGPIPVALLAYPAKAVKAVALDLPEACSFTSPTVLDQGPWPYFFPSPTAIRCGRTMSLVEVRDETNLVSEFLHLRVPYRRSYILEISQLSDPLPPMDLKALRNLHLLAVRMASGCDSFGEDIP